MYDSDQIILTELIAGNEAAFRQLFSRYHQQLGAYIFRITNSYELAEEIVQDIFLKIWLNREVLANVQNFKAYLFVLSKNYALNHLRRLSREQLLKNRWEEECMKSLIPEDITDSPYYSLLDEAIDQLPPQQQKVYLLSRHERLKYSEIAEHLNLSRETVKKYLKIATASITEYVKTSLDVILLLIFLNFF